MLLKIFIWLVALIYYAVAFNDPCRYIPCTCCSDSRCTLNDDNQYICRSCIDGYTGRSCEEPCPENCVNCSQTFYTSERICFACQNGYYKGRYKDRTEYPIQNDCSLSCTTGCESCTSYHKCNRCEIGYFPSSENQCIKCLTNCAKCSDSTNCEQCKDGYFVEHDYCRQCQQHCKTCISSRQCSVCELGYYLDGNGCTQCQKEGCLACISLSSCSSCQKGYHLVNGQCLTCGSNCIDCTLNSQSLIICNECQKGFYVQNGSCTNCGIGCEVCKSKTNCVICENGYQLRNGLCLKCPLNCVTCETDNYCNECQVGYFINNGQCNACHVSCTSCFSMEQCLTCTDGFYGSKCSYHCNENCYNNQCDKITGICLSCRKGYYFNNNTQCVSCPKHCTVCKSPSTCMVCEDGYKGETCQEKCSNCKQGTRCEKSNGYCFEECGEGLSGPNCDLICDQKCYRCTRGNPNECQTCAHDRYGVSCSERCSQNCLNDSCHDKDGVCRYGCLAGHWGPICENNCSSNCSVKGCDRFSGLCMFQDKEDSEETLSTSVGLIVGVVTVSILVLLIACIIWYMYRKRKSGRWRSNRRGKKEHQVDDQTNRYKKQDVELNENAPLLFENEIADKNRSDYDKDEKDYPNLLNNSTEYANQNESTLSEHVGNTPQETQCHDIVDETGVNSGVSYAQITLKIISNTVEKSENNQKQEPQNDESRKTADRQSGENMNKTNAVGIAAKVLDNNTRIDATDRTDEEQANESQNKTNTKGIAEKVLDNNTRIDATDRTDEEQTNKSQSTPNSEENGKNHPKPDSQIAEADSTSNNQTTENEGASNISKTVGNTSDSEDATQSQEIKEETIDENRKNNA